MKKLLVLAPFSPAQMDRIREAAGDCSVLQLPEHASEKAIAEAMVGADVVIGEPSQAAIAASGTVQWVQMTWAGTDKYTRSPIPFPSGVTLTNATGVFGDIISQYLIGMTLSLMQNFPGYRAQQQAHIWQDLGPVHTLEGATVLIFGAGDIGGHAATRLKAFGTYNIGVCRHTHRPRPGFDRLCSLSDAQQWLPKADVVLCCIPNSTETTHYLNAARLGSMKQAAVLVNAGRGNFIDCAALADCLQSGHLLGAALDVTDPEPLPSDHPLWEIPNCLLTPHVAGITFGHLTQTSDRMCALACDNLRRWRQGQPLPGVVRFDR